MRYNTALGEHDPIPLQPWVARTLDPANDDADKATFYDRVNANMVVELMKNTLSPFG